VSKKDADYRADDPRAPWNRARSVPGHKDRKRWCRGKVGAEHEPVLAAPKDGEQRCRPRPEWAAKNPRALWHNRPWWCLHHRECAECGKVLEHFIPWDECPDYLDHKTGT
jgi:hypothetical protein